MHRILYSGCSAVRRPGLYAAFRCQCRMAGIFFRCGYDRNRLSDDPSDPCLDADTGQYHRRCLQLYLLCVCRYSGHVSVQYLSRYHPCTGRLQDTCLFSDFIQSLKYRTGSVFHRTDRNRNSRCCLCYGDRTGCFRHSLPDLYEEKI